MLPNGSKFKPCDGHGIEKWGGDEGTAGMGSREGVGGNRRLSSSLFMSPIDGSAKANLFFAASLL